MMARLQDYDVSEDATLVSDHNELVNDVVPDPVDKPPMSIGESTTASFVAATSSALPLLIRATSQGPCIDLRSLDPAHTVGRTRVPWHSKSISDLRDVVAKPTRVVAFDVSGKLFRCKESLIAKYPLKRLNQIITCGCGKSSCLEDAFFIDRNPHHFEMILDWYRTEKLVRQRNVNEQAFKDDAIYFDLFEEMFPSTPAGELLAWPSTKTLLDGAVRRRSVNDIDLTGSTPKRVSMFATMASSSLDPSTKAPKSVVQSDVEASQDVALPLRPSAPIWRFFRRERRVLTPASAPLLFMMRPFEQLLVQSVQGRGKLLIRVCDATGMQKVQVSQAVVFDSHARFSLHGKCAQLQHNAVFPGDHVYTFWMAEKSTASGASLHESVPLALTIEFQILFTFDPCDRVTDAMETELTCAAVKSNDAIRALIPEGHSHPRKRSESSFSCLFMPPVQVKDLLGHSDGTSTALSSSTKVSPLHKTNRPNCRKYDVHASTIRHAGASIMHSLPRPEKENGTGYRPETREVQCSAHRATLMELHPHCFEKTNQAVEATSLDMQVRLFR